jgi:hypothetical protein
VTTGTLQLRHVDELEVQGEGPDQPGGGADIDLAKLAVERLADHLIVAIAELLGLCPHLLLEDEERLTLLLREGLSQQGADQSHVASEAALGLRLGARRWRVRLMDHLRSMPPHRPCVPSA